MPDDVITTSALSKRFGSGQVAVNDLTLSVRRGEVYYPYLSGRDNLRFLGRYAGVDGTAVDDALGIVALTSRGDDKVARYSLGMRQRLGVAAALLKDPELLVLDEPTNGLDPQGMTEMRRLIRRLGQGERTVVLSSHLLGEVEQVCDRVAVINEGRLVAEGTVDTLRGGSVLVIAAEPSARAREVLQAEGVEEISEADGRLRVSADLDQAASLNAALVGAGVAVSELRPMQRSLEDVFLQLTGTDTSRIPGTQEVAR